MINAALSALRAVWTEVRADPLIALVPIAVMAASAIVATMVSRS